MLTRDILKKRFDTSLLDPNTSDKDLIDFIEKCLQYEDYIVAIAVNANQLDIAFRMLKNKDIDVVATIAYPLGTLPLEVKVSLAKRFADLGVDQIDVGMNLGAFKSGNKDYVKKEISEIVSAVKGKLKTISIIPYTCMLTKEEIAEIGRIIAECGATMIKTNPGYGYNTRVEDDKILKETVGNSVKIMASGGVRNLEQTLAMIEAGADRIATSTPFQIFEEAEKTMEMLA